MNILKFDEIANQYEERNKDGNGYALFEKHKDWFTENKQNGNLKEELEKLLEEILQNNDLKKYDFVLLTIQAIGIKFNKEDKHFELMFKIAESIMKEYKVSIGNDRESWLLHQLTDICIHNHDELTWMATRNPEIIPRVVEQIGKISYEISNYGPQMYFAAYKAVDLIWHLSNEKARKLVQEVYLNHFDIRAVEETEELIENLKLEERYL